jgi:hypothetical protein
LYEDEPGGPDRRRDRAGGGSRLLDVPPRQRRARGPAGGLRPGGEGGTFSIAEATLAGETKRAIAAPPNGRITFHVKVPEDGWLKVSLGVKPEAWTVEGNGVYFYAGVSDGKSFEQLFNQTLNPFANASERRWVPVTVDLSAYAGEEINLILNTVASGPGGPPDDRGDMPLWGAPEVVRR